MRRLKYLCFIWVAVVVLRSEAFAGNQLNQESYMRVLAKMSNCWHLCLARLKQAAKNLDQK